MWINRSSATMQGLAGSKSHELLRQFAEEKLEEDKIDAAATRERHGAFFAEFMEKAWLQLRGPDQKETISQVKEDIDNVRAGWDFFLHNKNIPMLWKYIYGIWYFYWIQWWNQPAMALFQNAADELENCSEPDANALRCLAQALQCYFMAWLGLSEEGYHLSHSSAVVLEKLGWKIPLIFALYSKTINAYLQFSFKEQA